MNTTPTDQPTTNVDRTRCVPGVLDDSAADAYRAVQHLRDLGPTAASVVDAVLDVIDQLAGGMFPRFVVVQRQVTFGGDDHPQGYAVVDRNLAQPGSTIGCVVITGDYLECQQVARMANADPVAWDAPFDDDEPF